MSYGTVTIRYANGGDDEAFWDQWEYMTLIGGVGDEFTRSYHIGNYQITMLGDFGDSATPIDDDTTIYALKFSNTSNDKGLSIAGVNISFDEIKDWFEALVNYEGYYTKLKIVGGDAADLLSGHQTNDILSGQGGDDQIYGGYGRDRLTGGEGADIFLFEEVYDSKVKSPDVIMDFVPGEDDIDLSDFFNVRKFKFIESDDFTGKADQLRVEQTRSHGEFVTYVEIGLKGDRKADFRLEIEGHVDLTRSDFFL